MWVGGPNGWEWREWDEAIGVLRVICQMPEAAMHSLHDGTASGAVIAQLTRERDVAVARWMRFELEKGKVKQQLEETESKVVEYWARLKELHGLLGEVHALVLQMNRFAMSDSDLDDNLQARVHAALKPLEP